jgi:hypothetical protein
MTKNDSSGNTSDPVLPDTVAAAGSEKPEASTKSEKSVAWINGEVLDPPAESPPNFSRPYADQIAAMMVEDARAFMQGTEQVLVIAISRALAQIIETNGNKGTVALQKCEELMEKLPTFGTSVAATAKTVLEDFSDA